MVGLTKRQQKELEEAKTRNWANRLCRWISELLNGKPLKYDNEGKWHF